MKCPKCNAHNPDTADFCSLCLTSFRTPAPEPTESREAGDGSVRQARQGRIRRTDEGFDWQCDRCQSWTPLEVTTCHVCQRPFRAAVSGVDDTRAEPDVDPRIAIALSAVAPGVGHVALKRTGTGIARLGLFLLWFLAAVTFFSSAQRSGASALPALPLAIGALVLWAVTLVDVVNLAGGRDRPVLDASKMLWLVAGTFVATVAAMLPGILDASNQREDVPPDDSPIEIVIPSDPEPSPTSTGPSAPAEPGPSDSVGTVAPGAG